MNKTKRTLIVSSVVMALVLVVTVVSITAAWFSNTVNTSQDNFTINSTTLQESANITIGDSDIEESNTFAWPAVLKEGVMQRGESYPSGTALKNASEKVLTPARVAVFYFPINFIGSSDLEGNQSIDGRRSLVLKVNSAKIVANVTDENGQTVKTVVDETDYKDEFNVEMSLVTIDADKKVSQIDLSNVYSDSLAGTNDVYYYQSSVDGEPDKNLYMLLIPGEEYYVKATIYFNKVDEEYDNLLYLNGKTLGFDFMLSSEVGDVNIRAHKPKTV